MASEKLDSSNPEFGVWGLVFTGCIEELIPECQRPAELEYPLWSGTTPGPHSPAEGEAGGVLRADCSLRPLALLQPPVEFPGQCTVKLNKFQW